MFGTKHTISISISRNRLGRRPRSLFDTDSSKHMDYKHGHDNQKRHGIRNVRPSPRGENLPVGRRVLDGRFLSKHGRPIWKSFHVAKLCEAARDQRLQTNLSEDFTNVLRRKYVSSYPAEVLRGYPL